MSENDSKPPRPPRPLTPTELGRYQKELDRIAEQFDECSSTLRQSGDATMIPELRSALSRAGRALTRLLHHRIIVAPSPLPPWLSWRTRGRARPRFRGLGGRYVASWNPKRTVLGLVQVLRAGPQVFDKSTPRRPKEDDGAPFIRRHTWIEAVAGWLGQRCTPRLRVDVPSVPVVIATDHQTDQGDKTPIHIVRDWFEDATLQRLLFLELGRESAAACRYLSAELGGKQEQEMLAEIEAGRRKLKRQQVEEAGEDVAKLFSLWQDITDLLFRTNLSEDARVEELAYLHRVASALSVVAYKRKKPRAALQSLISRLRTLMPREWFQDRQTRALVTQDVMRANPEVADLYLACSLPGEALPMLKRLHKAVNGLAGNLSNLLLLVAEHGNIEKGEVTDGLVRFAQYVSQQYGEVGPGKPHRDELWQLTARDLKSHYSVAKELWEQEIGELGDCLRLRFAGASNGTVECGPLNDSTFHGLLIVMTGVILYPDLPGVVPQYALAKINSVSPGSGGGVVRLRIVRELYSRPWWRVMELELDKEYARVLRLSFGAAGGEPLQPETGDAPAGPAEQQPPGNEKSTDVPPTSDDYRGTSKAAVTAIVRAVAQLREEHPDDALNKKQIKLKAKRHGGAGDLAVACAIRLRFITEDYLLTDRGRALLKPA